MGYFSNGTEGLAYEDKYCRKCVNYGPEEGPGCPVWGLHLGHNYDQNRPKSGAEGVIVSILESFIPMSEDGLTNLQCKMFLEPVKEPDPAGAKLPGWPA